MTITEIYQELVESPATSGGVERRAAPACPLNLFLFVDKPANRIGFRVRFASALLSEGTPLPQFRGLEFSRSQQSGQAVLVLRPTGEAYKDVFIVLVDDIVTHASSRASEAEAATALLDRLGRWQTLSAKPAAGRADTGRAARAVWRTVVSASPPAAEYPSGRCSPCLGPERRGQ